MRESSRSCSKADRIDEPDLAQLTRVKDSEVFMVLCLDPRFGGSFFVRHDVGSPVPPESTPIAVDRPPAYLFWDSLLPDLR
jgi:hypothetical protein